MSDWTEEQHKRCWRPTTGAGDAAWSLEMASAATPKLVCNSEYRCVSTRREGARPGAQTPTFHLASRAHVSLALLPCVDGRA